MKKSVYYMNSKYEYFKSIQIELEKKNTNIKYFASIYKNDVAEIIHTELFPFECFYSFDSLITRIQEVLLDTSEFNTCKIYLYKSKTV